MRLFLHLLALVALLVAPLAAPAAAMAPVGAAAAVCQDMDRGNADHRMPMSDHRGSDKCCVAVPTAIDPALAAIDRIEPPVHLAFVAAISAFRLGAGPKAEDPPPRRA